MTPLIVFGGGGHARVTIDIVSGLDKYEIVGYVDSADRGVILGVHHLGSDDEVLERFVAQTPGTVAAIGIGILRNNTRRTELFHVLERAGYSLPPIVSRHAVTGREAIVGAGTLVCHNATVQACAQVGKAAILNTGSIVEHDCHIGDFVHIAPGAVVCGGVEVGEGCLIGAGAVVVPGVKIPANCVIGAGAVVTGSIERAGTFVGIPARRLP
jgi:UDP-perosamine 4-acetyltransferase